MMNFFSKEFLIACCLMPIVFHWLPWKWLRRGFLCAANFYFLTFFVHHVKNWTFFAVLILVTYAIIRLLERRLSWVIPALSITALVFFFLKLKRYTILAWVGLDSQSMMGIELVGLSYILFKTIHMIVDQTQKQLAPVTFLGYVNYQLSMFTLVAGPIQRYNDFARFWDEMGPPPPTSTHALRMWSRILTGMIKLGVLAPAILNIRGTLKDIGFDLNFLWWGDISASLYVYPIHLYFNFSGYVDIMTGFAGLMGLTLPENFNRPFLARNIIDFWDRWHITLTRWIRDYVFMSSYKLAAERFPTWKKPVGYGLMFLALLLAGIWHGPTLQFAVFGTIHGLGAAANRLYGDLLRAWLGPTGLRAYQANGFIHALAILLTFHYVCFSFLFFSGGVAGGMQFLSHLLDYMFYLKTILVSGAVVIVAAILLKNSLLTQNSVTAFAGRFGQRLTEYSGSGYLLVLAKTVLVVFLMFFLWALDQKDPEVVYMRF